MKIPKPVATVFVDANILKFSAVKHHLYRRKTRTVNWGDSKFDAEHYEPFTVNEINKIKSEVQRRDALFLGMLAYTGTSGMLKFYSHREVDLETWGLPKMASPSGRFFGCPIDKVPDPVTLQSRIILGGKKTASERTRDFLGGIKHPRFIELLKVTGGYQGKTNPLNLNQALDAYHIWCAESANLDYFLTMDYKLQRVVAVSKIITSVALVTPYQLLEHVLPKFGLFGAIKFMWSGYWFAKPRVGFQEGEGWR